MIHKHSITLPSGNTLDFFVNDDSDTGDFLLCVDLVDEYGNGGNEIVRMCPSEEQLLAHL